MVVRIAITIRSFGATHLLLTSLGNMGKIHYINNTGKHLDEKNLCHFLDNIDGVIAGTEKFTRRVFELSPNLRVISRIGVGLDSIDLDAAHEHGVTVVNTPDSPALAVAEHTIALMLSILKRIAVYNANIRKKDFHIESGLLLSGRSVGIVGLGRVGYKVANMLDMLGCKIFYYDPFLSKTPTNPWNQAKSLKELLSSVDIISLHVPPNPDGKPLLDKESFEWCKKNTILINTARGSLVDENALGFAINKGIVLGAGLDVFSNEPYTGKLTEYQQVVITPHVASNTIESRQEMEKEAIKNLINELRE